MGKVSTLIHFPLEPGCEDHYFLDQTVKGFEHGLGYIFTDSTDTPELDAFFNEAEVMHSLFSAGFLNC